MSDPELLLMSEKDTVRRIEVFTGAGRRRAWSSAEKARIVSENYASPESVSAVARRHGLTAQQLFTWRRKARRSLSARAEAEGVSFAPVVVDEEEAGQMFPGDGTGDRDRLVWIRVPAGVDMATLRTVLCAVKAAL